MQPQRRPLSSVDIPSSPPPRSFAPPEGEQSQHETPLAYSSPPRRQLADQDLSPTQTLAASSPELPPLPPFPAIARVQRTPLATSEGAQSLEGGKGYYTASWGSPYQKLPSGYSDASQHARQGGLAPSSDVEEGSPDRFGLSHLVHSRLPTNHDLTPTRPNTPTRPVRSLRDALLRARPPLDDSLVAEKSNWPGDLSSAEDRRSSQGSLSEWDLSKPFLTSNLNRGPTPTLTRATTGHKARVDNLTVTQEDIWEVLGKQRLEAVDKNMDSKGSGAPGAQRPAASERQDIAFDAIAQETGGMLDNMASPTKTQTTNPTGPQRPVVAAPVKKRVVCKGKTCWILLPSDVSWDENGMPMIPMQPSELAEKIAKFEKLGYDTRGFNHWSGAVDAYDSAIQSQNRAVYPEAGDLHAFGSRPSVCIPDKKEWDDYVKFLTEEKLRRLGVTLGDEPAPPPSASSSRQTSSQFGRSSTFSPPLSSAEHQQGPGFPPGFMPGHASRQSMASPVSFTGNSRVKGHMHRQSMFVSPPNFPQQPTPPGLSRWSPQPFGSSNVSVTSPAVSAISGVMPLSAGGAKSPVSPFQFPTQQGFPFGARDELLAQMQRQQQFQLLAQRPSSTLQELQEVPEPEDEVDRHIQLAKMERPEIANPRPRHSKNVSVQLQQDVEKDGYHIEDYIKKQYIQDNESVEGEDKREPTALKITNPDPGSPAEDREKTVEPEDRPTVPLDGTPSSVSKGDDSFDALTSPTSGSFTTSGHVSKASSVSRFNVDAKEFKFNPSASFNPGIFSSSAFSFQPANKAASFAPAVQPLSSFGTNVKAPEFNPAASFGSNFSGDFNFGSSVKPFKPDAPAFQPGMAFGSNVDSNNDQQNKIFSGVDLNDIVKPAKKSKAIPIVKPKSPERDAATDEPHFDEFGRLAQADGRQKRARRADDDGDSVPQFAIPSDTFDVSAFDKTPEPEPGFGAKEGSATPTNDPTIVQQLTSPDSEPSKLAESSVQPGSTAQSEISLFQKLSSAASNVDEAMPKPKHSRQTSSLSATAKPFEFRPWTMQQTTQPEPDSASLLTDEDDTRELVVDVAQQMKDQLERASSPTTNISDQESAEAVVDEPRGASDAGDFDFDAQASFNDIDEVMKQLNEDGSDVGVERTETTWPQHSSPRPVTATSFDTPDLKPPVPFRSDAPSPSPRRIQHQPHVSQPTELEDGEESTASHDPFDDRAADAYESLAPGETLLQQVEPQGSDWDDVISSTEDLKVRARSKFFDKHVDSLLGNALDARLGPVEQTLLVMQQSLAMISDRTVSRRTRRAREESDADDEDESEVEGSPVRSRSVPRDRRLEKIKTVVQDALREQRQKTPPRDESASSASVLRVDPTDFYQAIADVKASAAFFASKSLQLDDVRDVFEETFAKQKEDAADKGAAITALGPDTQHIAELAKNLAEANHRADHAIQARRETEGREENLLKRLALADEELVLLRASLREDSDMSKVFERERAALREQIEEQANKLSSLADQNAALEATLKEYRISHEEWKKDVDAASAEKDKLRNSLDAMHFQAQEAMRVRESMRGRLGALRAEMTAASNQMAQQQAKWHRSDEEHRKRYEILTARLGAEARTRERLEQEMERLENQEREGMRTKVVLEETLASKARLEEELSSVKLEALEHQKTADKYAREFQEARESGHTEVQRIRSMMQTEIDALNAQINIVRADLEAEVTRVQNQFENHKMDSDTAKERHELILEQEADARRDAVNHAEESRAMALQEQAAIYEQRMEELRQQHSRAIDTASKERSWAEARLAEDHKTALDRLVEDKGRSEQLLNEKLALSDAKLNHVQDKVLHLEEKLEVTKSAAHAAAVAAQSAKAASPSVATQPASMPFAPITRLPEKISPQALRESIAVLQEQLQERESRIENLESELSAIDKDAPEKLKERDTELSWLRELLGVRQDDLTEVVNALAHPNFNREAVRNAAIRIRTSLQMELQEKERLMNGGQVGGVQAQVMPALASLSSFASPKAAQLAAAIGNWRKNSAVGTPSALGLSTQSVSASSSRTQTPSRVSNSSQSFLSGLMTPPQSNLRQTPSPNASAGTQETEMYRPSSSYSTTSTSRMNVSPRTRRTAGKQPVFDRAISPPPRLSTPPLLRKSSYDQDAESASGDFSAQGFYDDESTLEGDAVPFQTFGGMQ